MPGQNQAPTPLSISSYLWQSVSTHPWGYIGATGLSLLQTANNLISPFLLVETMNKLQTAETEEERMEALPYLLAYAASLTLGKGLALTREWLLTPIGTKMSKVLAEDVLRKYNDLPHERYINDASAPPVSHFGAVKDRAPRAFVNILHGKIIQACMEMVAATTLISARFGVSGAIIGSALFIHLSLLALGAPKVVESQNSFVNELYGTMGYVISQIGQYINVNIYNASERELENFRVIQRQLDQALDKSILIRNLAQFIQSAPVYSAAVIGVGLLAILNPDKLSSNDLFWVIIYLAQFAPNFDKLSDALNTLLSEKSFFEKALDYLNQESARKAGINSLEPAIRVTPETASVEFRDVSLRYKGSKTFALQHFSLKVPSGKLVVITGQSGAGKTSLLNLMLRFTYPTKVLQAGQTTCGQIIIGEDNIENVSVASLRDAFAIVPQQLILKNVSIRENVAYANINASQDEINEAIRMAGLWSVLQKHGDNSIGLDGGNLSGGERQKIAIARALIRRKNASVLVLDEPTSALDPKNKKEMFDQLSQLVKATNKTTFVITHDLAFLEHLENIYEIIVLHNGRIVERGTKEELMRKEGGLFAKQFKVAAAQEDLASTEVAIEFDDD